TMRSRGSEPGPSAMRRWFRRCSDTPGPRCSPCSTRRTRARTGSRPARAHSLPGARDRGIRGPLPDRRDVAPAGDDHPSRAAARRRRRAALPESHAPGGGAGGDRRLPRRDRCALITVRDVLLATLVAVLWGAAFVATRIGLDSFSPPQLAALRFLIASAPVAVLPRPAVRAHTLIATGATLYAGQFLLQFFGIAEGMPPGLASLVVQTQAFFTVLFAAIVFGERPTGRQLAGIGIALAGLLAIAATAGQDLRPFGFALTLGSAVSGGLGNIFVKRLGVTPPLDLMVWLSLVVPPPALALSLILDGPSAGLRALTTATWMGWAAVLYLGLLATVLA